MSSQQVDQFLHTILNGGTPSLASAEKLLSASLKARQENPHWKFYTFELAGGPFQGGELRLSTAGDRALLSLTPRADHPLTESDFNLRQWGQANHIDINPQIPPEGTDAYRYNINGAGLSFQFTHVTRRLRTVTIEWPSPK
jgi:hypothetical protein